MGMAELGYVDMSELKALRGKLGLLVERDRHFEAKGPLSEYTREAMQAGRIVA
jgi:hypothetical protein